MNSKHTPGPWRANGQLIQKTQTGEQLMNAYDWIAKLSNPMSRDYLPSFPGAEKMGLNPDEANDKKILDFICFALEAGRWFSENGDNSSAAGKMEYMLENRIVNDADIFSALDTIRKAEQGE